MMEFKSNVQRKLEKKNAKEVIYDFLTPVSEYVKKVYGEIEEDLTRADYAEIVREIRDKNTLVIKNEDNIIRLVATHRSISDYTKYNRYCDEVDIEKKRKEEPIAFNVAYICTESLESTSSSTWLSNMVVELKSLYYVNDYNKFSNYILDDIKIKTEEIIEKIKKETEEKIENTSKIFTDLKEFGIEKLDYIALEQERTVKELRDPKTSAKRVLEITSELAHDEDYY